MHALFSQLSFLSKTVSCVCQVSDTVCVARVRLLAILVLATLSSLQCMRDASFPRINALHIMNSPSRAWLITSICPHVLCSPSGQTARMQHHNGSLCNDPCGHAMHALSLHALPILRYSPLLSLYHLAHIPMVIHVWGSLLTDFYSKDGTNDARGSYPLVSHLSMCEQLHCSLAIQEDAGVVLVSQLWICVV